MTLGRPRLHLREIGSTNARARELALAGAPHGTAVTAGEQTAGRGRQGRGWSTPPGSALALSLVIRDPDPLLSLRAGLAVADLAGPSAAVKWPNDVLLDGRKVAGVLVEGRPQEGWAVLGIGVNAALDLADLPEELRATAGTLGRHPRELPRALADLLAALEARLAEPPAAVLAALRERDALLDRPVRWEGGSGTGAGIGDDGALLVRDADGAVHALAAGEVHLQAARPGRGPAAVERLDALLQPVDRQHVAGADGRRALGRADVRGVPAMDAEHDDARVAQRQLAELAAGDPVRVLHLELRHRVALAELEQPGVVAHVEVGPARQRARGSRA